MSAHTYKRIAYPTCIIVVVISIGYTFTRTFSPDQLINIAEEHKIFGALIFGSVMFFTTVFAPLTALPLVPLLSPILGPFITGLAAYTGWLLGAVVSFAVGRHFGQPVVERYVPMGKIREYEKHLNPDMSFFYIVALRMIVPVDILSYALGIGTHVPFKLYVYATAVGIAWFSFAFAYLGETLLNGNYVLFASIGVASVVILTVSWVYVRRTLSKTQRDR